MSDLTLIIDSRDAVQASKDILNIGTAMGAASKSAQSSASVFVSAFQRIEKQIDLAAKANISYAKTAQTTYNAILGVGKGFNSAEDSANAFSRELRLVEAAQSKTAAAAQEYYRDLMGIDKAQENAQASASIFGSEIERLSAKYKPLYAASQLYEKTLGELNTAQRLGVISSAQLENALEQLNLEYTNLSNGTSVAGTRFSQFGTYAQQSARGMNRFGMVAQQVGYQVGDFFVQVQSGQSALVAFAQQGTQLAGLLPGVAGAIIGIGLALTTAIIGPMLRMKEATQDVAKTLDELQASVDRVNTAMEVYSAEGLQGILDKYGEINAEILTLIERQTEFAVTEAIEAAQTNAEALKIEMEGVLNTLDAYQAFMANGDAQSLEEAAFYAEELQTKFGLTVVQAEALELAINAATGTENMDTMASALASILTIIDDTTIASTELEGKLLESESAVRELNAAGSEIGGWLGAAIAGASSFAAQLWGAAAAARAVVAAEGPYATQDQRLQNQYGLYAATRSLAPEFAPTGSFGGPTPPSRPMDLGVPEIDTGGSSGGGSETKDPLEELVKRLELEQELLDMTEDQRRVAQALGDERGDYNAEELAGVYALIAAIREKEDATKAAAQQAEDLANVIGDSFSDAFDSLIEGTKLTSASFRDMAVDILKQLFDILVMQRLVGSFDQTSGTGTGIVGTLASTLMSFDGGGYTGSGPRSGGMDGKGGMLAMVHPNETVVDHSKPGSGSSGAGQTIQNFHFNLSANGDESVKRIIAGAIPAISKAAMNGVIDARKRGGQMRNTF